MTDAPFLCARCAAVIDPRAWHWIFSTSVACSSCVTAHQLDALAVAFTRATAGRIVGALRLPVRGRQGVLELHPAREVAS